MIEFPRSLARQFRTVFRRCFRKCHGPCPALVHFQTDAEGLHIRVAHPEISLAFHEPRAWTGMESVSVPVEALADFEGRSQDLVHLEFAGPDKTLARWQDAGIPQGVEYAVQNQDKQPEFPKLADKLIPCQPSLLESLDEAAQTASSDGTRYALNRILLRGKTGEVVGTDGRQLLVQGGFSFPWTEDALVPKMSVLRSKDLGEDPIAEIGKTDTHVILRIGAWTFFLRMDKDARFPRFEQIIPKESAGGSRLRISAEDAGFLVKTLPHLPGQDEENKPLTLDLNGQVSLRARAANQEMATEVLLARSEYTGKPVQVCINREYLARAVQLGFKEVHVNTADTPLLFKDEKRLFVCMPLSKEGVLPASEDVVRIASAEDQHSQPSPQRRKATVSVHHPNTNGNGHAASPMPSEEQLTSNQGTASDLLAEALALKQMLHHAYAHSSRLVVAIKKQRRQSKLVASTLTALKQLQRIDA